MADRLRGDSKFLSGALQDGAFDYLSKLGVIMEPKGEELDSAAVITRLHLTGEAAQAADELLYSTGTLFTFGHETMLMEESGSAGCQSFAFFRTAHGKSQLLPQPPIWMDGGMQGSPEEGSPISQCLGSTGHLARVNGVTGYVANHDGYQGFSSSIDFVPIQGSKWGKGCSVDVDVETLFPIDKIKTSKDGPLDNANLTSLAPKIARAFRGGFGDEPMAYDASPAPAPFKTFVDAVNNGPKKLPEDEFTKDGYTTDDVTAFAMDGHGYVLRIAHPTIGWRDIPGMLLTFYDLNAKGDAVRIAAVVLDETAGKVLKIQVSARP